MGDVANIWVARALLVLRKLLFCTYSKKVDIGEEQLVYLFSSNWESCYLAPLSFAFFVRTKSSIQLFSQNRSKGCLPSPNFALKFHLYWYFVCPCVTEEMESPNEADSTRKVTLALRRQRHLLPVWILAWNQVCTFIYALKYALKQPWVNIWQSRLSLYLYCWEWSE